MLLTATSVTTEVSEEWMETDTPDIVESGMEITGGRLILTFSYCLYKFLREQELGTGRSPDTDKADSFHGQIRWAKLNDFAPEIQDVMELWALRPHAILVKVISVCRLNVFFHQYVADLREERSENVLRTVSTSPFNFDVTVSSTSGVITTPPKDLAREILPLFTGVNILHGVNTTVRRTSIRYRAAGDAAP